MIVLAAISLGVIFAVFGYRLGFFAIWAMLFNIVISIYLAVMATPTVAALLPTFKGAAANQSEGSYWYAYAALAAGVAIVSFVVLQVVSITYFTGTFHIPLPRLMDNLGAAFAGFAAGYIVWGFICFIVLIMPVSGSAAFKSFTSGSQSKELSVPTVSKVVNIVNAISLQPNRQQVKNVISWTLGWDVKEDAESLEGLNTK